MGKKLAIAGHPTRGNEVIEILGMLCGKHPYMPNIGIAKCNIKTDCYYMCDYGFISWSYIGPEEIDKYKIFTLEEFLEKYPFKVGDKVFLYDNITIGCVTGMKWEENTVKYCVYTSAECWCDVKELLKWNALDLVERHYGEQCEEMLKDITLKHLYELGMENIKDEFRKDFCERCGSQRCSGQDDELEYCERFKNLIKEEIKSKREYDELRMPLDDNDKLATEATIMGKKILPPDGYLVGKITQTDNGMLVEYVEKKPKYPNTYEEDNYCETLETKVLGHKVDDVIFTDNTGWIRITNTLWDCYAKEHVYEGIGIINEYEYKDIRHHNVTGKMVLGLPKHYKNVDVDDVRDVNSITDDIMINQITNKVSVIKLMPDVCDDEVELNLEDYEIEIRDNKTYAVLKKPKYPKTYEECCEILVGRKPNPNEISFDKMELCLVDLDNTQNIDFQNPHLFQLNGLFRLLMCRNAYWKIAGEEMGLGKPWEPRNSNDRNIIRRVGDEMRKGYNISCVLEFPTVEMRDAFYENFKELIESCKELL